MSKTCCTKWWTIKVHRNTRSAPSPVQCTVKRLGMAVLDMPFRQSKIPSFCTVTKKKLGKWLVEKNNILWLLCILKRHFLAWQRVNNIQRKGFCSKHSFQCSPCWTTVSHHFHADNMSKNFRKLLEKMENKSLFYEQFVLSKKPDKVWL